MDRANHHPNHPRSKGSVLAGLDDSLIDFLRVVKLCADSLKIFVTVTFMVSVSCYIVAVVTLRVLGPEMPWIQRLTFHNWTVCGLLMLAMMLVPLAKLDTKAGYIPPSSSVSVENMGLFSDPRDQERPPTATRAVEGPRPGNCLRRKGHGGPGGVGEPRDAALLHHPSHQCHPQHAHCGRAPPY